MERALQTERSDIFIDYVGASDELTKGFDADGPETLLKSLDRLHHDRWSKHRVVTSLQWSPHYNGERVSVRERERGGARQTEMGTRTYGHTGTRTQRRVHGHRYGHTQSDTHTDRYTVTHTDSQRDGL